MLLRRPGVLALSGLALSILASLATAQQCPEGQYWCGDRCGTDRDTCCQAPEGIDVLCGPETICCGFGCCPDSSYTCNADFSCTGPDGEVIPAAPKPGLPDSGSGGVDEPGPSPSVPADSGGESPSYPPSSQPSGGGSPDSEAQPPSPSPPNDEESNGTPDPEGPASTTNDPSGETAAIPGSGATPSQPPESPDIADPGAGSGDTPEQGEGPPNSEASDQPSKNPPAESIQDSPQGSIPSSDNAPGITQSNPSPEPSQDSTRDSAAQGTTTQSNPPPEASQESTQDSASDEDTQPSPSTEPPEESTQDSTVQDEPSQDPLPSGGFPETTTNPPQESTQTPIPGAEPTQEPSPSNVSPPPPEGTEANETSTVTTLPPGAWLQTLGDEITEGTVVTTTASGSDEPTVVPIIVPIGGPPQICWGCIPSFPANIKVKIPEFCVDILGLKIGNCPSEEEGPEPTDEEKPTDDDNDEDDPSSTTSCTVSVTATYESVFCSVTQKEGAVQRRDDITSCSTLAYTTITACETAVGSTTTSFAPQETDAEDCDPITQPDGDDEFEDANNWDPDYESALDDLVNSNGDSNPDDDSDPGGGGAESSSSESGKPTETSTAKESPTPTEDSKPDEPSPTCKLHIHEYFDTSARKFHVEYEFSSDKQDGDPLKGKYDEKWDKEHLITASDTGLEHDISVNMAATGDEDQDRECNDVGKAPPGGKIQKTKRACNDKYWEPHLVKLKYDSLSWDSKPDQDLDKTPNCKVGGWDQNTTWDPTKPPAPNRQMDCRFDC